MVNPLEMGKTSAFSLEDDISPQLGYFFPKESLPEHLQSASGAVGRIIGNGSFGTCFVVGGPDGQYLVSAKHCTFDRYGRMEEKTAILPSGKRIKYKLPKSTDPKDDILIAKLTEQLPITPLKLANTDNSGRIIVIGFPLKRSTSVASVGNILRKDHKFITTNSRVEAGSSGSPLLNENGEVIGLVSEIGSIFYESAAALLKNQENIESHRRLGTLCVAISLVNSFYLKHKSNY